ATMASEGSEEGRAVAVAEVASRIFGASIGPDAVIDESLQRATDDTLNLSDVLPELPELVRSELPTNMTDESLTTYPLAVWTELMLGLEDGLELKRRKPIPFEDAVEKLSADSGVDAATCQQTLETFLTCISLPETERGGAGS